MRPVDCIEMSLLLLPDVFSTNECLSLCEDILKCKMYPTRVTKVLNRFAKYGMVSQLTPVTPNHRELLWVNLYFDSTIQERNI